MSCPPQLWPGVCSDCLCHLEDVRREQFSQGRITSDVPAPLEMQAVKDLVHACGKEMQAKNLNASVAAQVGVGLIRARCANFSDPSLLLEPAGGCCTETSTASPVPAESFSAEALAVGLSAEDGN